MLTKSINGRAACHYCGQCGRGCQTASAFSSSQAMIFPAMKTGKLTVITGAMARELITERRRQGHRRLVRRQGHAHRKAGALPRGGGGGERLRIGAAAAEFEIAAVPEWHRELVGSGRPQPHRQRRATACGGYDPGARRACRGTIATASAACTSTCPWWLHDDKKKDFPRGYHIELGGGFGMPHAGQLSRAVRARTKATARRSRTRSARSTARIVSFAGRGEMIPNKRLVLRDRPDTRGRATASRCCASTSAGASTRSSR